jgi:drug/metabolite transporter (DMT)-like permease
LWALVGISERPVTLPQLPITWVSLVWLGVLGSGIAFLLYFYLIHSVGPTRTTLVTYVFPLVGIALGVIFLNESLDWRLALGALLILGSIVVVNSSK